MRLEPLPYHVAVADYLERMEPELWKWFRSDAFAEKYRQATEVDLLRTAIRLERTGPNERRYALAETARDRLELTQPITLYQMQQSEGAPNAFLVFKPDEIAIAFAGRILELLVTDAELLDLLGHEISHFKLFKEQDGRFHTVDRLLIWLLRRDNCPAEFGETWRRNRLFTEIYCDIGGLVAAGDRDATIRGLVKSIADFKDADAESYLKQARELLAMGPGATRGLTHPELHVRVLAIAAASDDKMERPVFHALLDTLITGKVELGNLDLVDQQRLTALTRRVLDRVLSAKGVASDEALAHARQMFPDYALPACGAAPLPDATAALAASSIDYLCYVLIDLGAFEGVGSTSAMTAAASAANELGIGARFREIARLELKGRRTLLSALVSRAA